MNGLPRMTKRSSGKSQGRTETVIRLRVICLGPPAPQKFGAEFGLQDNSTASDWVIHPGKPQTNGDIHFECECRVSTGPHPDDLNFLGPFAHGPRTKRFLYLSWRPGTWRASQPESPCLNWVRRMKLHLGTITHAQIDQAIRSNRPLETSVAGTGRDGGPSCGSVPLIGGWKLAKTKAKS